MVHFKLYSNQPASEIVGYKGLKSPAIISIDDHLNYTRIGPDKTPIEIYRNSSTGELSINTSNLTIIGNDPKIGSCRIGRKNKNKI